MSSIYKNIVFSKHALERMGKRSITKEKVWQIINHPDKKNSQKNKYIKTINDRKYHIIATYLPKEKKYLIISTWVRGEDDRQSIIWLIIALPFKLIWWLLSWLLRKFSLLFFNA